MENWAWIAVCVIWICSMIERVTELIVNRKRNDDLR